MDCDESPIQGLARHCHVKYVYKKETETKLVSSMGAEVLERDAFRRLPSADERKPVQNPSVKVSNVCPRWWVCFGEFDSSSSPGRDTWKFD